jgi:hypothetical protein
MKKNTFCLKITTLCATIVLMTGCETGVKNQGGKTTVAPSGIVDKGSSGYVSTQKSSKNIKTTKIFSNSATPGYYVQVGYFGQAKPNKSFMKRLDNSNFNYTVLDKNGDHYALVGPYYSYNQAKNKMSSVRSSLASRAFVVQVLRP